MDFNFTSQICTSKEQSERLLALGLKKETADMHHYKWSEGYWEIQSSPPRGTEPCYIPAWSLHRLIELCAIPKVPFIRMKFQNTYDEIISLIAETIKFGAFNKEYLEK